MDLCEFEASLIYRVSSRTARATQRNPVSKKSERERDSQPVRETDRKTDRQRDRNRETDRE